MTIRLSPELASEFQRRVLEGTFVSAEDVVREGLKALRHVEQQVTFDSTALAEFVRERLFLAETTPNGAWVEAHTAVDRVGGLRSPGMERFDESGGPPS